MSKLSREAEELSARMDAMAKDVEAFSQRRLDSLPADAAWALLRSSVKLLSAASKVQLKAAQRTAVSTKKHFSATAR
jgi:hypothetical protein